MTHMRLNINGQIVLDDDLGEWQRTPPEMLSRMIKPGAKPQPWMKAILIAMVDAAVLDQSTQIDVRTSPSGWVLSVESALAT